MQGYTRLIHVEPLWLIRHLQLYAQRYNILGGLSDGTMVCNANLIIWSLVYAGFMSTDKFHISTDTFPSILHISIY
jgi:hypothetical protein